jgi:hypothetical protein
VAKKSDTLPAPIQQWVDARKRYHLSHAQVQMARELGLNPRKFGGLANHRQEPWKVPLPRYIEHLYLKRFGRERPQVVTPAEQWRKPVNKTAAEKKSARVATPTETGSEHGA